MFCETAELGFYLRAIGFAYALAESSGKES
jgi:hypothetical protein